MTPHTWPRIRNLVATLRFVMGHPLNRGRKARALVRYLAWQVRSRLGPGPVVHPWVAGSKLIVRAGETGLTGNIYCGLHEFAEMAYVLHAVNAGDEFVDIGANVGSYTVLACAARGARGYSFEPVPTTFDRLMENIALNRLGDRVRALNLGLSDQAGELIFTADADSANHVVAEDEHPASAVRVQVRPLDEVIGNAAPSIVKIDVEGFETRVLRGADATLRKPSLHSIIMEINGSGRRYGFNDADLVATMSEYGFLPCDYEPFSRALLPIAGVPATTGNMLFVRDVPRAQARVAASPRVSVVGVWF